MSASEKELETSETDSTARQDGRGSVVGVIGGTQRPVQSEPGVDPDPSQVEAEVSEQSPSRSLAGAGTVVPFLVGGLSGAVMAIITVFLITTFRPPLDPRVVPMTEQLNGFVQQMYNLETGLRSTEVDLVRLIDAGRDGAAQITKQNAAVAAALSEVSAAREEMRIKSGPGSPVFGVATVQLAAAVQNGRPFESEWVNIFALTAGDPAVRESLMPLVATARDGVTTATELSSKLRARAEVLGLPIGEPDDLLQTSMSFLQSQLGIPVGFSANEEVTREVLSRVDQFLLTNQVEQAMGMFASLGASTSEKFADWASLARQRQNADRIVANLQDISRDRLSNWARETAKP